MNKVNVLGTEYSIEIDDGLEKTCVDGLCKEYDKQITIRNVCSMLCDDDSIDTKKIRFNEVLRHEIIHASDCRQSPRQMSWIQTVDKVHDKCRGFFSY